MFRILSTLFCLTLALPSYAGCEGPSAFDALPKADQLRLQELANRAPYAEGLLWQIDKNGVTSFVIGTMHLPEKRHGRILKAVEKVVKTPTRLFMELNAADETAFQRDLTANPARILITDGPSLIDRLGPDAWAKLVPQLETVGLPPFVAAKYQPWFLGLTLSIPACAASDLKAGKPGLDRQIETWAQEFGVTATSLDDTQALFNMLAGDPLEEQVEILKWSLMSDVDLANLDQIPTMLDMYFAEKNQLFWEFSKDQMLSGVTDPQDLERLRTLLHDLQTDLIDARNAAWVKVLSPELSETPALVAFGALHLPGENGVLAGLERQGFAITRVPLGTD